MVQDLFLMFRTDFEGLEHDVGGFGRDVDGLERDLDGLGLILMV